MIRSLWKLHFCCILLFFLSSCDSTPPENWPSSVPPSVYRSGNVVTKTYYLKASEGKWSNSGINYDSEFSYKVRVLATVPNYSTETSKYRAIANGAVSLCNHYGKLLSSDAALSYSVTFPIANVFSEMLAFAPQTKPATACAASLYSIYAGLSEKMESHSLANGINIAKTGRVLETLRIFCDPSDCCHSYFSGGYYAFYGCSTFNGVPFSGSLAGGARANAGAVEYIIDDKSEPDENASGTALTNQVKGKDHNMMIEEVIQSSKSGRIWFRVIDADNDRTNNYGQYEIAIEYPEKNHSFISKVARFVIEPITYQVQAVSIIFWENLVGNQTIKSTIGIMVTLYIIIFGIFFALGFIQLTQRDAIGRVIKIAVLFSLITENSYQFFNKYLFKLFVDGQKYLINIIVNPEAGAAGSGALDYNSLFGFTNYVVDSVFSSHFLTILGSLILWFPIGWISFIFLLLAFVKYTLAVIEAIIMYLIAFTAIQFLISLGPIFIAMLLFDKTKELFSKWLEAIIAFTMQPVILFASIIFITALINGTLYNIMAVRLEWKCVLPIYLDLGDSFGKISLFCINWLNPITPTMSFVRDAVIFYLLVALLSKLPSFATDLSKTIFGGGQMTGVAVGAAGGIMDSMKGVVGMDAASVQRRQEAAAKGGAGGIGEKSGEMARPAISGVAPPPTVAPSGGGSGGGGGVVNSAAPTVSSLAPSSIGVSREKPVTEEGAAAAEERAAKTKAGVKELTEGYKESSLFGDENEGGAASPTAPPTVSRSGSVPGSGDKP